MQPTDNDLKAQMIQMISEEKEALVAYRSLCARFQIQPNPTAEAVVQAKVQVLETLLKSLLISKQRTGKFGS
jgi:hypothetical protein